MPNSGGIKKSALKIGLKRRDGIGGMRLNTEQVTERACHRMPVSSVRGRGKDFAKPHPDGTMQEPKPLEDLVAVGIAKQGTQGLLRLPPRGPDRSGFKKIKPQKEQEKQCRNGVPPKLVGEQNGEGFSAAGFAPSVVANDAFAPLFPPFTAKRIAKQESVAAQITQVFTMWTGLEKNFKPIRTLGEDAVPDGK